MATKDATDWIVLYSTDAATRFNEVLLRDILPPNHKHKLR